MKNIKFLILVSILAAVFTSCRKDEVDSDSIFDTTPPVRTEFDKWLLKNYTEPFNINLIYRYVDRETSGSYNVIPAEESKARALAIMIRHIWLDAYKEALSETFIKTYSPRVIQLIGSPQYNGTGSMTLGIAEGGLKISLLNVNSIDPDNIYIDTENAIAEQSHRPIDLNYWFFHTMHHEFCHILTQTKDYPTDFNTVSAGTYIPTDWHNKSDAEMIPEGFVSAYASEETNEDFAECYSYYVTHSEAAWQALLTRAKDGATKITKKMDIVRQYFHDSWEVELDSIRSVVLKRTDDIRQGKVDIKNLKF